MGYAPVLVHLLMPAARLSRTVLPWCLANGITIRTKHFVPLHILACVPCLLKFSLFLVLCVVAVPFRVKRVCLRHSSLGAARPDILPHQHYC
jgi:hypothetical protein